MATHRKASVEIVNETGKTLLSVSVSHKYSDNYKNEHTWKNIKNGETTSTEKVDFNTGFLTTGRDWWVVTWVNDRGDTYVSDPHNFRNILDFLEKIGDRMAQPLATLAAVIAVGDPEPSSKAVAAAIAVTSFVAISFLNSEGTDGFKQHILREEDCDNPIKIIIKEHEIEFKSKSGNSTTGMQKM